MYSQRNPSPDATARKSIATRQRVSRACDRCNHLRVKCDGRRPCEHCLVYGLDCKYERERKKRGKGSLTNSSKENCVASSETSDQPNLSNTPMVPITAKKSPRSTPGTFHLSIPPSYQFNGNPLERKEGLPSDFLSVPTTPSPSHLQHNEPHQTFFKSEPGSTRYSFSSVLIDGCSRDEQSINAQDSCYYSSDASCYAAQLWGRVYDAVDQPKILPSSIPIEPEHYQHLPYMPLCASCQSNPSTRLYPGSIVWLPSPTSPYYVTTDYGAAPNEEEPYCFTEPNSAEGET